MGRCWISERLCPQPAVLRCVRQLPAAVNRMITVVFNASDLAHLADPALIAQAEARMIERGVEILQPIARDEAPMRTGRGRKQILGTIERRGGHLVGRVHAGKAFYLRILAVGAKWDQAIRPFRYAQTRRGGLSLRARRAAKSLGPGRAFGAARALRFRIGGRLLFRPFVHHPALRPDPWLERAARAGESRVGAAADAVVQEVYIRRVPGSLRG